MAPRLTGIWRGRLVDVLGFEGELELDLVSTDDGQLHGTFGAEIGGHHSTLRRTGKVRGKGTERAINLVLVGEDQQSPVKINLKGDVLELRDGGVGMRATYQVSAEHFSPLQGGILTASKDRQKEVEIVARREMR
jgi:hypothetical protein